MRPLPKLAWRNIRRPPAPDRSLVGISFVDVLFALVIGQVLTVATRWDSLTAPGVSHLVLAFVLTVTSWIGYHNSLNRPRYFIRFTNLPLWQFLTDVALVIVYWLLANYVDDSLRERSALPEAVLTLAAFALYFVWDRIGLAMRRAPDYTELVKEYDNPDRRYVTELFAIVALLSAVIVFIADVRSAMAIVVVDVWLIVVVAGFRVAKEATPTIEPSARPSQERLRRALDALERALVDLKSLD